MLERLRIEALGPKGALKVALDDEAFDPAGYLSAGARTIAMEPDGRFTLPAEFASALGVGDGVMLVGKGDKFQLWNPSALASAARFRPRQDGGLRASAGRRRRREGVPHVPVLRQRGGRCAAAARRRPLCRRHLRRRRLFDVRCSMRAACAVIGIDRDPEAIAAAAPLAKHYAPRLRLIEGRFGDMAELLLGARRRRRSTAWRSISASPRCSSTSPSAASPSAPRGPLDMRMEQRRPLGRRSRERGRRSRARRHHLALWRGAAEPPRRPRDRRGRASDKRIETHGRARRDRARAPSARRIAATRSTQRRAPSRRCALR